MNATLGLKHMYKVTQQTDGKYLLTKNGEPVTFRFSEPQECQDFIEKNEFSPVEWNVTNEVTVRGLLDGRQLSLTITRAQFTSLNQLRERHPDLSPPFPLMLCDGAIGVQTAGMMIGIEKDGYAHT